MISFISPTSGKVTSGWGRPREYRGVGATHEGLDFNVKIGTPIYAVASGKVITSKNAAPDPAGEMVSVDHGALVSRYMHLSKRLVSVGQSVSQGQLIAYSGDSGIKSSAPHLHFDLKAKSADFYKKLFGTPKTGLPGIRYGVYGVPSEPFIPADYSEAVKADAAKNGIPIATAFPLIPILLLAVGGYVLWKYL